MRIRLTVTALILGMSMPVAAAWAQSPSLGDLARKEQERRKALTEPAKVYSNDNLPKPPTPAAESTDPAALPPPVPVPTDQKPADAAKAAAPKDEKDEAWWRARMTQARETVRRGEMFADALQSRINALGNDAVNRDDPYQRAKLAEDRQKAIAELGQVKSEIEAAKKQIADIEEDARQAGAPPGWLR